MKIALVCAESSGDSLGAGLAQRLAELRPGVVLAGVTGPAMRAAGVQSWLDHGVFNIMGYGAALAALPRLLRARGQLRKLLRSERPAALVGIDAPDLNLRLAQDCQRLGIPYVQYVCPSFWAWRPERAKLLEQCCALVLAILPFEQKLCEQQGIKARFVGHRLADEISADAAARSAAREQLGIGADEKLIALLPGSRMREVKAHERLFAAVAKLCRKEHADWRYGWGTLRPGMLSSAAAELGEEYPGQARLLLQAADAAVMKSGTATLEAALAGCPQVIAHRLTGLDKWLALPKLGDLSKRFFGLPNLILDRQVVPEFMQDRAEPTAIATALQQMMQGEEREKVLTDYAKVREAVAQDADRRAAEAVLEIIPST